MRARLYFSFLFTFIVLIANCNTEVDSLLSRAKEVFGEDRVQAYNLEIKALEKSIEVNYLAGIIKSNYYLGFYFQMEKEFANSIVHYLKATQNENLILDDLSRNWIIKAYKNLGNILSDHDAFNLAEDFYNKGLMLSQQSGNYDEEKSILYNSYKSFHEADNLEQSEESLLKLKNLAELYSKEYFRSINGLAQLSLLRENYSLAEIQYLELLSVSKDKDNILNMSYAYHNLGDVYFEIGDATKSIFHFSEAIRIKKILNNSNTHSLFLSYQNLGELYVNQGQLTEALANYNHALSLVSGIKNHPNYFYFFRDLSNLHKTIGNNEIADEFGARFMTELVNYSENQAQIKSSSQQYNMRLVVNSYYQELESQRAEEQSKAIFMAIIVGLSTMLFLFVGYHFISRYYLKRMLTQSLDRLEWTD